MSYFWSMGGQDFDSQTVSQQLKGDSWANATIKATNDPGTSAKWHPLFRDWATSWAVAHFLREWSFFYFLKLFSSQRFRQSCLMKIWFDSLRFVSRDPTRWRNGLMPAWWFQTCSSYRWNVTRFLRLNVVNPINHPQNHHSRNNPQMVGLAV